MGSKLSTKEVIQRIIEIHKHKYDLSKVVYKNKRTKITLICKEHGPWNTGVEQLYRGQGCTICGKKNAAIKRRLTFEEFELKAKKIHKSKYNYFRDEYVKSTLHTEIQCVEHGLFKMLPTAHIGMQKQGCPQCGFIMQKTKRKMSLIDFKTKADLIHSKSYDYKLVEYNNQRDFVKIICKKHGVFEQNVSNHLTGSGCPDCNNSKGENKVKEILIRNDITFVQQKTFENLKDFALLKCDFYLPKYNTIIEFNGRQHYEIVKKFGGEIGYLENKRRYLMKRQYFKEKNMFFIEIHYKEKKIEDFILNKLDRIKSIL